jgi:hypothetical protein
MTLRFTKHFVPESGTVSRQQRHEVETSFLRFPEWIERAARCGDFRHSFSVLPLGRGDQTALKPIQLSRQIRMQTPRDRRCDRRLAFVHRSGHGVEALVEQSSRFLDFVEHVL